MGFGSLLGAGADVGRAYAGRAGQMAGDAMGAARGGLGQAAGAVGSHLPDANAMGPELLMLLQLLEQRGAGAAGAIGGAASNPMVQGGLMGGAGGLIAGGAMGGMMGGMGQPHGMVAPMQQPMGPPRVGSGQGIEQYMQLLQQMRPRQMGGM